MFIFIPSSFIKLFFPAEQRQSPAGRPRSLDHPLLAQPIGGFAPPSTRRRQLLQLRATVASPRIPRARHITLPSLSFPSFPLHPPATEADLALSGASVSPVSLFSLGPPQPPPGNAGSTRDPPSTAQLGPSGSQHLTFPGAEPWQGEGAAYAEQMESIKTKGSGPASSYYPSKGLKRIYRHPQPHGKGEPAGAREKCPECSDAGARTTGRPFASLCPRGCSAKPSPRGSWGHLPISRSFSALCIAPPACSLGPHRSRATRRLATTMPPGRVAAPSDRLPELQVASCFSLGFISWWKR